MNSKNPEKDDVDPGVHITVLAVLRAAVSSLLPVASCLSLQVGGWEGDMEIEGAMEVFSAEHLLVSQPVEAGRTRVATTSCEMCAFAKCAGLLLRKITNLRRMCRLAEATFLQP